MSRNGKGVEGTVGSLLAIIAHSIQDALRTLIYADKRAWGSPEFEQLRLLEETLEEAKRDFQDLPALVNGRLYYENDRKEDSLDELRELCTRFEEHSQNFKNWVRAGGPIEPEWATDTRWLRRELHRAQCRAVRRIHDDLEGSSLRPRCLGALIVWRSQQRQRSLASQPRSSQPQPSPQQRQHPERGTPTITTSPTTQPDPILDGEVAACNATGTFQRLGPGNRDIAFVCDFCDGFLVWEDLRSMPSTRQRTSTSQANLLENWAATGFSHPRANPPSGDYPGQDSDVELEDNKNKNNHSSNNSNSSNSSNGSTNSNSKFQATAGQTRLRELKLVEAETELKGEEKTIVFPAVAVANHLPPDPGEWQAPLLCPLCDEYYYEEQGDDDMDRVRYTQDERGFDRVAALQEHLEWTHASLIPSLANVTPKTSSCVVM